MYVYAVFLLVKLVFFQVTRWETLMETSIDPGEWGWKTVGNKYVPVMTDEVR